MANKQRTVEERLRERIKGIDGEGTEGQAAPGTGPDSAMVEWLVSTHGRILELSVKQAAAAVGEATSDLNRVANELRREITEEMQQAFSQFFKLYRDQSRQNAQLTTELRNLRYEIQRLEKRLGSGTDAEPPAAWRPVQRPLPDPAPTPTGADFPQPPLAERIHRFVATLQVLHRHYGVDVYRSALLRNCRHADYPLAPISPKSLSSLAYTYFRGRRWQDIVDWALGLSLTPPG